MIYSRMNGLDSIFLDIIFLPLSLHLSTFTGKEAGLVVRLDLTKRTNEPALLQLECLALHLLLLGENSCTGLRAVETLPRKEDRTRDRLHEGKEIALKSSLSQVRLPSLREGKKLQLFGVKEPTGELLHSLLRCPTHLVRIRR
jgi:hypothetical protein